MTDKKKKVLIVDDDRQFTKILDDWLKQKGFETDIVHNGNDAVTSFDEHQYDAVLLDALLPKLDGFKACQKMRLDSSKKNIPIIMMSAIYKRPAEAMRAKNECGANEFLLKPVNLTSLHKKLLHFMAGKD